MGFTSHRGFESRPLRSPPHRGPRGPAAILEAPHAPVAQLDRASVYGTEGQRFESSRARWKDPATASLSCAGESYAARTVTAFRRHPRARARGHKRRERLAEEPSDPASTVTATVSSQGRAR